MAIRLGASAVIVQNNQILLVKFDDDDVGIHYNLPGGGVEDNELLEDAVRREVLEETCIQVDVGRILFMFEYVPIHHRYKYGASHKVNVLFGCKPKENSKARMPDVSDKNQIDVCWVPLSKLAFEPLLPQIGEQLKRALNNKNHYPIVLRENV